MFGNVYISALRKQLPGFTVKKVPNERCWRVSDQNGWWFLEFGEGPCLPSSRHYGKDQAIKDAKKISQRYAQYKSKGTWV